MKAFLSQPYVWYFFTVHFFSFFSARMGASLRGSLVIVQQLLQIISSLGYAAAYIFLIIGFFKCESWWYPLVMGGISFIAQMLVPPIRILELILGMLGLIAIPVFGILMYVNLFS